MYYRARWYDPQVGRFTSEDPISLAGGINQFAYVGNNPQNATDPSGLYEIDVHYYLTYYLAIKNGCFDDREARLIANADQYADENLDTKPGYDRQYQNATFHALHPGSHQPYLDRLWQGAVRGDRSLHGQNDNLEGLGLYLHYLQDMFSHQGYTDPKWGHASGTHAVDKTDDDVPKAQSMVAATWKALTKFGAEKKCGCQRRWTSDMWPTINEFLRAPGGDSYTRQRHSIDDYQVDPRYLNDKIRILRVPSRF